MLNRRSTGLMGLVLHFVVCAPASALGILDPSSPTSIHHDSFSSAKKIVLAQYFFLTTGPILECGLRCACSCSQFEFRISNSPCQQSALMTQQPVVPPNQNDPRPEATLAVPSQFPIAPSPPPRRSVPGTMRSRFLAADYFAPSPSAAASSDLAIALASLPFRLPVPTLPPDPPLLNPFAFPADFLPAASVDGDDLHSLPFDSAINEFLAAVVPQPLPVPDIPAADEVSPPRFKALG